MDESDDSFQTFSLQSEFLTRKGDGKERKRKEKNNRKKEQEKILKINQEQKNAIKLKKLDEVCDKRVRNPWGVKDWHPLII